MKCRRVWPHTWIALLWGIVLISGACTSPPPTTPTPAPTVATAQDQGIHVLIDVQGKVTRTRPGWTQELPLSLATMLSRADLLRADTDATGVVVCADLKTVAPIPGGYLGAAPCPQTAPLVTLRGDAVVVRPLRQTPEVLAVIPYVLAPRRSFIVDDRPLLRWHDSTPGAIYSVRVWGDTLNWETTTTATELRFPDDAPSLQPGTPYYVAVTDGNGRTSEEEKDASALDLSFVLMGDAEIADVNSLLSQVSGLAINDLAKALLISEIYHARSLRTDAIAQLQGITPAIMSPAVQQRLADLYLAVGLYLEAEQAFNDAVDAYRNLGDIAGEAYSLAGRGMAQRGLIQDGAAIQDLEAAAALYQRLNDLDAYEQTQERLNSIRGAP
ncbi:hypothetical protein GC175_20885 [bacterium]|nr:hypothetical protein [bacterium]